MYYRKMNKRVSDFVRVLGMVLFVVGFLLVTGVENAIYEGAYLRGLLGLLPFMLGLFLLHLSNQ